MSNLQHAPWTDIMKTIVASASEVRGDAERTPGHTASSVMRNHHHRSLLCQTKYMHTAQ